MDGRIGLEQVVFGRWRHDLRQSQLSRREPDGSWLAIPIGTRAAAVLTVLLREPGQLISKEALIGEVWPDTRVEPNNLTVQIAALRRVLDEERSGDSLVQTVAGRGYRFVGEVGDLDPAPPPVLPPEHPGEPSRLDRTRPSTLRRVAVAGMVAAGLVAAMLWSGRGDVRPRLSLVVQPFRNLGGIVDDDHVASAMSDDLVVAMSRGDWVPVVVRSMPSGSTVSLEMSPKAVGRDFDARYALRGSVRRTGKTLHVNAQLVSTVTGQSLWTGQFDVPVGDHDGAHAHITRQIAQASTAQIIVAEDASGRRERPGTPDALDLVIRAAALQLLPPSRERLDQERALYERAIQLDPESEAARFGLIDSLLDGEDAIGRGRKAVLERTRELLGTIRAAQPLTWRPMASQLHWLSWQYDRCPETVDLGTRFLALYPGMAAVYRWIGDCQTRMGKADAALPMLETAYTLDDGLPWQSHDDRNMQYALLLLGRYDESIAWGRRALADNPEDLGWEQARLQFRLAAADALAGRLDIAQREVAEGMRLAPETTIRQFDRGQQTNPAFAAQLTILVDGLRRARLRDHADPDADFGVPSDDRIHQTLTGPTPTSVPGARIITTAGLATLLAGDAPVVVDTLIYFAGRSIPGATGLKLAGTGGELFDIAQDHLRSVMRELTHGNLATPVIAAGWNSEDFSGRNLALRLAALGYTRLYWYRGGREDWEVSQQPETMLEATSW